MKAGIIDYLLMPIYVMVGYIFFRNYAWRKINQGQKHFRFLPTLFLVKAILGSVYCIIYTYYYTYGGDSVAYFTSSAILVRALFMFGPYAFIDIIRDILTKQPYISYLNEESGYFDLFSLSDTNAIFTTFYTIPFTILGFNNYILATIVLNVFSTLCYWKLFELLLYYYPHRFGRAAKSLFFFPSILFWGSGILKDNYCLSLLCIYVYCFFKLYIIKEKKIKYYLFFFLSIPAILSIKPYVVMSIIPGSILWYNYDRIKNIKNVLGKFIFLPVSILLFGGLVIFLYVRFGEYLGEYSYDKILEKAVKTQRDMMREEAYSKNYFNIGEFDPTVEGVLSKFFPAIVAVFFRPWIWECNNLLMLMSGLENTVILMITIYIVFKVRFGLIKIILQNPFLFFSFTFAVFFGFSVGLTTSNFGALVRLKIPSVTFYLISLMMIYTDYQDLKMKKLLNLKFS